MDNKHAIQSRLADALVSRAKFLLEQQKAIYGENVREPEILIHYSSNSTIQAIIESENLRLFDATSCNDAVERIQGLELFRSVLPNCWELLPEEVEACSAIFQEPADLDLLQVHDIGLSLLEGLYKAPHVKCFVACFSGNHSAQRSTLFDDNLVMWRTYAEEGVGAALAFCRGDLTFFRPEWPGGLYDVTYDRHDQESLVRYLAVSAFELLTQCQLPLAMSWTKRVADLNIELSRQTVYEAAQLAAQILSATFKHEAFAYENEHRLLFVGPASSSQLVKSDVKEGGAIREYVNLQDIATDFNGLHVAQVGLGPRANVSDASIDTIIEWCEAKRVPLIDSRIPYRGDEQTGLSVEELVERWKQIDEALLDSNGKRLFERGVLSQDLLARIQGHLQATEEVLAWEKKMAEGIAFLQRMKSESSDG